MFRMNAEKFRYVALAEAASFLTLLVCTAVKYGMDQPLGVKVMGPIHGFLFIVYVFAALMVAIGDKWSVWETLGVLVGAVVPFGGFAVDRWLTRRYAGRINA